MDALATIVIPARNASSTIERCIRSALIQPNCEILLIDDFSSDDTVARAIGVGCGRVRVIRPSYHHSLGLTRQAGLDAVETPFGIWLDADDELLPGRADRLLGMLARNNVELATDVIELFDGGSSLFIRRLTIPEFIKGRQPLARLFERNYLQGPGCLAFRRDFARKIGYDLNLHGAEDVDFVLRSVAAGARFGFIDEPGYRLYAYRSSMSRRRENQSEMYRSSLLKHDYESVYRLFQEAGYNSRVTVWALVSMALFRREFKRALDLITMAEAKMTDAGEILEPSGPCPMPEGWRLAFFRGTTLLMLDSNKDSEFWLSQAESIEPTAEGANNLGVAMAREGKPGEAQKLFAKSLDRFPAYSDAQANRDSEAPHRITLHPLRREPSRADY